MVRHGLRCGAALWFPRPVLPQIAAAVDGGVRGQHQGDSVPDTPEETPPSVAAGDDLDLVRHTAHLRPGVPRARYILLLGVAIVVAIQLYLPDMVTVLEWWLGPPIVELPLGLWAFFVLRKPDNWNRRGIRNTVSVLFGVMVLGVAFNSVMLLTLLFNAANATGKELLFAGFGVITMNVFAFGLSYWWLDSGGPVERSHHSSINRDFLFPQQTGGKDERDPDWRPSVADYLYVAYTNIFAFSPTDTMPLSHRSKAYFTLQSAVALMTITFTLGLAVNLLN
jgi:hypothetical protein